MVAILCLALNEALLIGALVDPALMTIFYIIAVAKDNKKPIDILRKNIPDYAKMTDSEVIATMEMWLN